MAGSLYLGSQRVCPAVVSGGSEPTEYYTFKLPDSVTNFTGSMYNGRIIIRESVSQNYPLYIDFNKCEEISGSLMGIFENQKEVILNVSSLKKVGENGFRNCFSGATLASGHTDITFDNLEEVEMYALMILFNNVTSVRFPKVSKVGSYGFAYSFPYVDNVHKYFNALTTTSLTDNNSFNDASYGATGQVYHFPSNLQTVIQNQSGYPNFGGDNTTILFDLEPTE